MNQRITDPPTPGEMFARLIAVLEKLERKPDPTPLDAPVMNVADVAELLRCDRKTIYNMVQRGKIPVRRVGRCIRFSRAKIIEWLETHDEVYRPKKRKRKR